MNKVLEWNDKYSVGVKLIDDQHQALFALINKLIGVLGGTPTEAEVKEITEKLVEYKRIHFATEEKYFEEFNYADKEEHIRKHGEFNTALGNLVKENSNDSITLAFKLVDYLEDWLIEHLMTMDQKYVECFTSHGLK